MRWNGIRRGPSPPTRGRSIVPWTWHLYQDPAPTAVVADVEVPSFSSRADAESWLGGQWRQLCSDGVTSAALVQDAEVIGQPLPLREGQ